MIIGLLVNFDKVFGHILALQVVEPAFINSSAFGYLYICNSACRQFEAVLQPILTSQSANSKQSKQFVAALRAIQSIPSGNSNQSFGQFKAVLRAIYISLRAIGLRANKKNQPLVSVVFIYLLTGVRISLQLCCLF